MASHLRVVQKPFSALQAEMLLKRKINAEATCPKMRGQEAGMGEVQVMEEQRESASSV